MASYDDYAQQLKNGASEAQQALGLTPEGFDRLKEVPSLPQKGYFGLAALASGANIGKDANETAGNVVDKLTAPFGSSTAADVLRTGLQTAATVGLDPVNYIAPGEIRGLQVQDLAKQVAKHSLETGDMSLINKLVNDSNQNLTQIIPRSTPSGLDVLKDSIIPTDARGIKMISGANEIAPIGIKPANPTGTTFVGTKSPLDSALDKLSTAFSNGEKVSTAPGTSAGNLQQVLEILRQRSQ